MEEKRKKLWRVVDGCETAVLISAGMDGFPHARTMERVSLPQVEEVWFATEARERKLGEIAREPRVTVFYSHPDKSWACIYGIAETVTDQALKSKLWKEDWERYWPDGPVSEDYVLIRVRPVSGEYLMLADYERGQVRFRNGE